MSSARKRAAIQKANNEAEFLRQRLMMAEHHASVMEAFARVAAARGDALFSAIQKHQADTRYAEVSNTLALADKELYEALKVGAGDTAHVCGLQGFGQAGDECPACARPNAELRGRPLADGPA